jgi:penicillin amidase
MERLQSDDLSLQAVALLDTLVRPGAEALTDPAASRAARLLLSWDGRLGEGSAAGALYHLFYQALLARCIRPPMEAAAPGLFQRYLATLHLAVPAVDRALATGDPRCFPGGVGPGVEACLAEAWGQAEMCLGPDPAGWRWGRLHTLTFRHALGRGRAPAARLIAWLLQVNRGPFPRPGDGMTVNLGAFCLSDPFAILAGPSYRQAVDLGRPEESRWALAGGASGDPGSVHYADQVAAWLAGRSRPMLLDPAPDPGGSTLRLVAGADCTAARGML